MTNPSQTATTTANANTPVASEIDYVSGSYLLFQLADERYALASQVVTEVIRWHEPTEVPGAPPVLPGLINQRGVVLPVVNLSHLLGLPTAPVARSTRYLAVENNDAQLALLVDRVIDLIDLETIPREPRMAQQSQIVSALVRLADQPVALLDLTALIDTLRAGTT